MDFKTVLLLVGVIVLVLILILFPEARALFSGFMKIFIKDMSTTPEGARAIYAKKIDEAQDAYNVADNALRKASGNLFNAKKKKENLQNKLKEVEAQCEALVKNNKLEAAQIKAEEREEIISDIERNNKLIEAYSLAERDAKELHSRCEKRLKDLKKKSKEIVENMKTQEELNKIYDDMDDLKNVTATDKLLDDIKQKNEDLNAMVAGARVIHENRTSTKIHRANEQAKQLQSNDYLESLKKKYNK